MQKKEKRDVLVHIDPNIHHHIVMVAERMKMPIRVIVDLLGEQAIATLKPVVHHSWQDMDERQSEFTPNDGNIPVKISPHVFYRLEKLVESIGMTPTTAINETWHARNGMFKNLRSMRPEALSQCWNAICATQRLALSKRNAQVMAQ